MARRKGRPLTLWLDDETYALLRSRCESDAIYSLPDCAALLLREALQAPQKAGGQPSLEALARRLERTIQDLLNPYTAKLDEIYRRLGEIYELIESSGAERPPPQATPAAPAAAARAEPPFMSRQTRRGTSAIERLKQEGVLFEEDAKWLRAPDKFFQKLEREGAIVLRIHGEHVAVDPDFWDDFLAELDELEISSPDEAAEAISARLGEQAARLFEALARAGLVYYDETSGRWRASDRLRRD